MLVDLKVRRMKGTVKKYLVGLELFWNTYAVMQILSQLEEKPMFKVKIFEKVRLKEISTLSTFLIFQSYPILKR
jgi:hypothetical protein